MTNFFRDFFFGQLPAYFKKEDTYVDNAGEGLLERYLRNFGLELDDEVIPPLENYIDEVSPLLANDQFLPHIAYSLGRPPDFFNDITLYRKILHFIIRIYEIKGTERALQAMFGILGFSVSIIPVDDICVRYDSGFIYDNDNPLTTDDEGAHYDTGCCEPCRRYTLVYNADPCLVPFNLDPQFQPVSPAILAIFQSILTFLNPIHASLVELLQGIKACEEIGYDYNEQVVLTLSDLNSYDTGLLYDNGILYDSGTSITVYV